MLLPRFILSTLLLIPAALFAAESGVVIKQTPVVSTPAESGSQMFKAYCASCHGIDAKGHGPAAPALNRPPHDLTLLSQKNQGKFPAFRVVTSIRGEANVASHGSKEMPVWGVVLGSIGSTTPREVELRISNLTHYIESLQQK